MSTRVYPMSIESIGVTENRDASSVKQGGRMSSQTLLLAGVAAWIIGAGLLVYFHFSLALVKPHYQYMVLMPVLIAFLFWNRHNTGHLQYASPSKWWAVLWLLPWAGIASASWFFSPWIGMAAIVLLGPVSVMAIGGLPLLRSTWGIWMLAVFLLPLPLRMDERLIVSLRDMATKVTSQVLDYFGILHMISGNVIELPEKKLFVADACSGIHSLFVLLAAAATVSVWNYRGPIATTLLLVFTFGLVMVENVLRLFSVSISIRIGYDLSEGVGHQILGFVLFSFSLAMILSFDQWLAFWSIPQRPKMRSDDSSAINPARLKPFVGFGVACFFLLPIQWLKMPNEIPKITSGFAAAIKISDLGENFLPDQRDGYKRVEYEKVVRVPDDPFGLFSEVWRYSRGSSEVVISLNYSYRALHDACLCYRNTGWAVVHEQVIGVKDDGQAVFQSDQSVGWSETPVLSATMSHPLEGNAMMFYSMLSESGKSGIVIDSRKAGTSSEQAVGRFQMMESSAPEQWIQLQMIAMKPGGYTSDEKIALETWYREVQAILFQQCLDQLTK